ncbi:MAG: hypothetical protein NT018_13030 [Armatimonadetes bacterium]|nr:hypothetical protein [Armatimonadota bacterium]
MTDKPILILAVIIIACAFQGCAGKPKQEAKKAEPALFKSDLTDSYYYPNIPAKLDVLRIPTTVLLSAATKDEIQRWAENEHAEIYEHNLGTVIVSQNIGSGISILRFYVYVDQPISKKDAKPWKLVYVGPLSGIDDIDISIIAAEGRIRVMQEPSSPKHPVSIKGV